MSADARAERAERLLAARGFAGAEVSVEGHPDPAKGELDPKVQAAVILAESEERTIHADPDDAQGAHRQSAETADQP